MKMHKQTKAKKKAGKLKLKGNKFTLSTEELELFFDGKTQWTLMKELNEVSISEPTKEEMLQLNPILIVNEFGKTHHVQFDADSEKDKVNFLLNLFPKENKFDHFKVVIVVQKDTKQVKKKLVFDTKMVRRLFLSRAILTRQQNLQMAILLLTKKNILM